MKKSLIISEQERKEILNLQSSNMLSEALIKGKDYLKYDDKNNQYVITNAKGVFQRLATNDEYRDYLNDDKSYTTQSPLTYPKQNVTQTDNLVKKLQGKILQTEFASLLGPKKDDGIWGKMTSQALSKLIEKYKTGQSTGLNQVVQKDTTPEVKNQTPEVKVNLGGENLGDLQGFTSSEFTDV
jgi:hypothetical protein